MIDIFLEHYGTKRHSGRYPWGSGEDPYQHEKGFAGYVNDLKKQGLSEKEIAEGLNISINELRAKASYSSAQLRKENISRAQALREHGYSATEIGKRMGVNESTVRGWLKEGAMDRANSLQATADVLRNAVNEKKYIDIGVGAERYMGISRTKLKNAVAILKDEGYEVKYLDVNQLGTNEKTSLMVLVPPGTPWSEVNQHKTDIQLVGMNSQDGGASFDPILPPVSVSSKRISVVYAEQGGAEKDGVIELRPGVDDISLGAAKYAQVRIAVDGTHYLKGMAVYSDDLPDGVDIRFNTSKKIGTPMMSNEKGAEQVLKSMKSDPENPFGASIKREEELVLAQKYYTDKDGNRKQSAINIVNEEGSWDTWSKTLASQMLSKQPVDLAKKQLNLYYAEKADEYDEIMSLTNPAVKKKLLESFADDCDASASDLKAAALPRQRTQVILPVTSLKNTEVYAPNFNNGEEVVLIRYPHGGTFEIPRLKVNNKNQDAEKMIGQGIDAIGINSKVASQLSGADFDGDSVVVIPTLSNNIQSKKALDGLKDFDPHAAYPAYEGMKTIKPKTKQTEMGKISNLITDMTIQGAPLDEICRAVKHSMVVIDAEKHNLDYKRSFEENGIAELKERYQGGKNAGASTLISLAGSTVRIDARKEGADILDPATGKTKKVYIDPKSGKKLYTDTGETYTDKKGKTKKSTTEVTRMSITDNAFDLSSGTRMEAVYATHANKMKALANQARLSYLNTPDLKYSPSAKKAYAKEVSSLNIKLNVALKNAPLERKAQIFANAEIAAKVRANPELKDDKDAMKKLKGRTLTKARIRVGARKERIAITPNEWAAIQAGALSNSKVTAILANTDLDKVKKLAMPRQTNVLSDAKKARIKAMLSSGHTQSEIAESLGLSTSTVNKVLKGE